MDEGTKSKAHEHETLPQSTVAAKPDDKGDWIWDLIATATAWAVFIRRGSDPT